MTLNIINSMIRSFFPVTFVFKISYKMTYKDIQIKVQTYILFGTRIKQRNAEAKKNPTPIDIPHSFLAIPVRKDAPQRKNKVFISMVTPKYTSNTHIANRSPKKETCFDFKSMCTNRLPYIHNKSLQAIIYNTYHMHHYGLFLHNHHYCYIVCCCFAIGIRI